MVRKTEENVIQRKKLRNTVRVFVCSEKEENVIQRKIEKHSSYIVCSEKMAMESRQVSTKVNR